QNFAQVTNPPIDSLRERYVMSLVTRLGNGANILNPGNKRLDYIELPSPVLLNASFQALIEAQGKKTATIDLTLQADENLRAGMNRLLKEAEEAVRAGRTFLVLADTEIRRQRVAIPPILATSAVHNHLIREGLRSYASINVRAADCLDVHYFAVLLGVGATTINPWLVQETIAERQERGLLGGLSFEEGLHRYASAIDSGILKVMSKMGISVLTSYRGGYNFEALGLSRALVSAYFPGLPSRLSGLGIEGLEKRLRRHNHAVWGIKTNAKGGTRGADGQASKTALSVGGYYRYRQGKEPHGWDPKSIHLLQRAIHVDSFHLYKEYLKGLATLPPIHLRDLLGFVDQTPIDIEDVESVTEIRKRMVAPGISLGALSPEAHETLAVAMNRIGARSDSGEGGEDPLRYTPRANGDNASSAIKQVASGRFGVTAEYLNNCSEIEIKIAQGAKPGEGGQLPGFKVSSLIAKLRYSTEGVTLISPPPHHDIYSIEDLAQLIYDLKQINPFARVCVKLVAKNGIGTVAAGVAKAHADVILVSGHSGGTGASPQSSIKYAGLPWEMGLAEVNQVLTLNGLRDKVRLRTDGGLKTGRDLVIAAMLGADEYGIGTASLVAMGCILVRQCHSNTCPVGICTQREGLRHHFKGHPDDVIRLFSFIADEVRTILAELGYRKLGDVIGRTDLLQQISRGSPELDDLDLNPLLVKVGQHGDRGKESKESTPQLYADLPEVTGRYSTGAPHPVPDSLDVAMIRDAAALFKSREKMELDYRVVNTHRTVGARISSEITRHFGMNELDEGYLTVRLRGSAGQSLGAWAVQGLTLKVRGDANDYVGKGLSGGTIIIAPPRMSTLKTPQNTIVGNTVLYGAVRGKLYAAGRAGERFAVRNSGADAVVEGCGANGCEYMTGGRVVILGKVGANFGAGMTGGMAWIYDPSDHFASMVNPQTLTWQRMEVPHWVDQCRRLVERHHHETRSKWAEQILLEWHKESAHFWQVIPKETVSKLHAPLLLSDLQANSAA
ncbi:MAG: glutamate synthase large subunit, partial [Alphaproteobacteria bacterium]|nr:glutamate synthase large subunit [Alphaproteobacteria bacterium]